MLQLKIKIITEYWSDVSDAKEAKAWRRNISSRVPTNSKWTLFCLFRILSEKTSWVLRACGMGLKYISDIVRMYSSEAIQDRAHRLISSEAWLSSHNSFFPPQISN